MKTPGMRVNGIAEADVISGHGARRTALSYSGNNGGNCVEAGNDGRAIAVRDSQDPDGTRLAFTAAAWRAFAATLKGGLDS